MRPLSGGPSAKVQKVGKGLPRKRWPLPRQSYDYTGHGLTYTRAYKASTTLPPFETFADRTRLQVGAGPACNLGKSLPQTDRNQMDYLLHNYGRRHLRQWNSSNWVSQMNCEMTKKRHSPINRIKGIGSHGCIGLIVVTRRRCSIVEI